MLARFLDSASVLDLATKVCFLDLQETRLGPRYMHDPDVDFPSSGSAPQSASEKAVIERGSREEALCKSRP